MTESLFGEPVDVSAAAELDDPYARVAELREAARRSRDNHEAWRELAFLLWRLYEFPEAQAWFTRLAEHAETSSETLRQIAHRYFEVGRFRESAQMMSLAVQRQKSVTVEMQNTWAWTLERDHQCDAARQQAEVALRIDPTYGPAVRLLAHLDRRAGAWDTAVARLQDHLRAHPGPFDWGLRYELAAILDRCGQVDEAWRSLTLAKQALVAQATPALRVSYAIRMRQWELTQRVTAADLRRWRADLIDSQPVRIGFLTGFPRSGTTLLEQILGSHPQVVDTDESGILTSQFIAPVVWHAPDVSDSIIEMRSWDREQLELGREIFGQFTERYVQRSLSNCLLLEKNPLLTADIPLAHRLFPEAHWLVALRDPRDVLLSYLFTMVPLNWSSAPAIDVREAARFYHDTMRHWNVWEDRLAPHTTYLKYESMLETPEAEMARVAHALGVTWDNDYLRAEHRAERRAVRTPTYHDVTQPLYRRAIGRWQSYAAHLEPALPILEPYLVRWGYST